MSVRTVTDGFHLIQDGEQPDPVPLGRARRRICPSNPARRHHKDGLERWLIRRLKRYTVAIPPRESERLASQHDIEETIPGLYVQTNDLLYHLDLGLLFDGDSAPRAAGLSVQEVAANMTTSYGHIASDMNINAAEFKAKCLKLIDEVAATHQPLVITKRGKPLVKLVPIEDETGADLFGYMKGTLTIADDIVQTVSEPWSAESGDEDDLYADLTPGGQPR